MINQINGEIAQIAMDFIETIPLAIVCLGASVLGWFLAEVFCRHMGWI